LARKPKDIATGYYDPVKDKNGRQVRHPKRGLKWKIRVELPRRLTGGKRSKRYRTVYGTERKAIEETNRFVAEVNRELLTNTIPGKIGTADATKITFGEYVAIWLDANKNNGCIKRHTWRTYNGYAKNYVLPLLGHVLLQDMSPYHITKYKEILQIGKTDLLAKGRLSPATINKQLSFISTVLDDASSPGKRLISYNPAKLIKRARGGRSTNAVTNCLSSKELYEFLDRLALLYSFRFADESVKEKPETVETLKQLGFTEEEIESPKALHKLKVIMLYPIVYLAAVTGMRLSELLALKWDNINFDDGTIMVYESSHYSTIDDDWGEPHHLNSTKEGKPKSFIELSDKDIEFLIQYRREQDERRRRYKGEYFDNNLVFARNNGMYLRNDTVSKEFARFAESNGFNITFHGLRHTHCTMLLQAGVPTAYVARRVGHQRVSTTSDIYQHAEKTGRVNLGELFHGILDEQQEKEKQQGVVSSARMVEMKQAPLKLVRSTEFERSSRG
jgi:integrase